MKTAKKPAKLEPVKPGVDLVGGWDLSEVTDDYLLAELIRRGRVEEVQRSASVKSPGPRKKN